MVSEAGFSWRLCVLRERSERARDGLDFDGEMGLIRPKWRSFLVDCVVKTIGWLGPTPDSHLKKRLCRFFEFS